jgi:tRNA A-37 threonylcarbamoyl transferase component Bud32
VDDRALYGEYDVESFLGKGSIGKVYLARHRRIGRKVALKTVRIEQKFDDDEDREEFYKRLQREAELCGALQHPNVVTLYDVGYENDLVAFLATEFVDGESLLARLRRTRPLVLDEALSIAADVLRGLAYAHSKGIIHRDIKPANILLTAEGQAKIADFGVARPLQSSLTAASTLIGTPNYMSPEQVRSTPVSTRSDLFSAGVVMYEMLTGTKPFAAADLSGILYNVVNLAPPLTSDVNPGVPEPVARVVARLLAKNPDERYATAGEALDELDRARGIRAVTRSGEIATVAARVGEVSTPRPTMIDDSHRPLIRRRLPALLFWGITITLIAALAVTIVSLRQAIDRVRPTAVIPHKLAEETTAKRRALASARALADAGRYDEALQSYNAYLARYPHSVAAQRQRAEVQGIMEESKPESEMTRVAKKPRRDTPPPEPEKPPSRWERFKKWFRGK